MTKLTSYQKTQVQCIQAQINYTSNLLKDFNDHKEEIFKLLEKWNGKKFNKRFQTQLDNIMPRRFYAGFTYYGDFEMYVCNMDARAYQVNGQEAWNYVADSELHLFDRHFTFNEGKTLIIDSEAIKQEITERVNNKAIYMEALQYELDNIDEALTQYEEINKQVQAFKNANSCIIREALRLDFKF